MECCKTKKITGKRSEDGKIFSQSINFTRKHCLTRVNGFTVQSSCVPYKYYNKQKGSGIFIRRINCDPEYFDKSKLTEINLF
jgi:hypothetical protein